MTTEQDTPEAPPDRGDLYIAHGPADPMLVVVTSVFDSHLIVCPAHPYVELACGLDAIITGATPYTLVVETDLRGCIDHRQLGRRVAQLNAADMGDAVAVSEGTDPPGEGLRGLDLRGPADPRWEWKAQRGRELAELASACTRRLLGE